MLVSGSKLDPICGSIQDGSITRVIKETTTSIQFGLHGGDTFDTDKPVTGSQLRIKCLGASRFCDGMICVAAECRCAFVQIQSEIKSLFARQLDNNIG